jgi:hypothetical protein
MFCARGPAAIKHPSRTPRLTRLLTTLHPCASMPTPIRRHTTGGQALFAVLLVLGAWLLSPGCGPGDSPTPTSRRTPEGLERVVYAGSNW